MTHPTSAPWLTGRRGLLAGGAGLAVLLSGCTSDDPDSSVRPGGPAPAQRARSAALSTEAVAPLARSEHASALLGGGLVLVIGGRGIGGELASCQVLDPADGTWVDAAPLGLARGLLSADVLDDGRVLCLGGRSAYGSVVTASVFDPEADAWEPVAPLATARHQHSTVSLGDGRFVVTGGVSTGALTDFEIYEVS